MTDVSIVVGSVADIPRLEPLWVAVHHQHAKVMPHLAPYVSDEVTWTERAALYRSLFEKYPTHLLLANQGDRLVGYGLAYAMPVADWWLPDTWQSGDLIGEIESLSVLPDIRGHGVGTRLMTGLEEHLESLGVVDLVLGVLPGNTDARRLYERRGYQPTWLYLSRLSGRADPS